MLEVFLSSTFSLYAIMYNDERINDLQATWQENYKAIRSLYDDYTRQTKTVIRTLKAKMRKTLSAGVTTSKIKPLLLSKSGEPNLIFTAEAPGDLVKSFFDENNKVHTRIHCQTFTPGLANLDFSQQTRWNTLMRRENVNNLNKTVKHDGGDVFLNGDLMDPLIADLTIKKAIAESRESGPYILSCDAGDDSEKIDDIGFDGWKVLKNLLNAKESPRLDIIVSKVQNGVRAGIKTASLPLSVHMHECIKHADKHGYRLQFHKVHGSWMGNDEIYVCFCRPSVISPLNPLAEDISPIKSLIRVLDNMVVYTKEMIEMIKGCIAEGGMFARPHIESRTDEPLPSHAITGAAATRPPGITSLDLITMIIDRMFDLGMVWDKTGIDPKKIVKLGMHIQYVTMPWSYIPIYSQSQMRNQKMALRL